MRDFLILFKHEFKMQFPFRARRGRFDLLGALLSLLTTLIVGVVFVMLISTIVENYLLVEIHQVSAPMERAKELLNLFYTVIILATAFVCMEKMRSTLTQKKDRELFLRLPVKPQTILMSKLCTLMIWNYIFAFLLMGGVNLIFYLALKPALDFWFYSVVAWLFLPMTAFFIATIFLVPYIKLIEFISNKYWLIFLSLSAIVIGAFVLYSGVLGIVQSLLETGSIKFLFNEQFIVTLQSMLVWAYPANAFASIVLGENVFTNYVLVIGIALLAILVVYFVSKGLFYATLYKNENRRQRGRRHNGFFVKTPLSALMRKEFVSVFREPKHLFSYFAIATAMPVMVYCCYTLFESLIKNAIGLSINFPLALLVLLIFSILTNTFCATNITRDGLAALKAKIFPIKASTILLAKVLFCGIVSSVAIIASAVTLVYATTLTATDAIICMGITLVFSLAQIFVATRMDLNNTKVGASFNEVEKISNRTVAKVVFLGLLLALVMGLLSLFIFIFASVSNVEMITKLNLQDWYAYALPAVGTALYFLLALAYYNFKIEKSFDRLLA